MGCCNIPGIMVLNIIWEGLSLDLKNVKMIFSCGSNSTNTAVYLSAFLCVCCSLWPRSTLIVQSWSVSKPNWICVTTPVQ